MTCLETTLKVQYGVRCYADTNIIIITCTEIFLNYKLVNDDNRS